jgi:hypothetical protein
MPFGCPNSTQDHHVGLGQVGVRFLMGEHKACPNPTQKLLGLGWPMGHPRPFTASNFNLKVIHLTSGGQVPHKRASTLSAFSPGPNWQTTWITVFLGYWRALDVGEGQAFYSMPSFAERQSRGNTLICAPTCCIHHEKSDLFFTAHPGLRWNDFGRIW